LGLAVERSDDVPQPGAPFASSAEWAPDAQRNQALNDVVEQYCVRCHNDRRLTGNLSLDRLRRFGSPEQIRRDRRAGHPQDARRHDASDRRAPPRG
jgi:hypothetical protein